jgi:hypothetical protein
MCRLRLALLLQLEQLTLLLLVPHGHVQIVARILYRSQPGLHFQIELAF